MVGDLVGLFVVVVGDDDGAIVSLLVEGDLLGWNVGGVGYRVGRKVGFFVGGEVGFNVGTVGDLVGFQVADLRVGPTVGTFVEVVGDMLGLKVRVVGAPVFGGVGFLVVGDLVGLFVVVVGDDDGATESPVSVGAGEGA